MMRSLGLGLVALALLVAGQTSRAQQMAYQCREEGYFVDPNDCSRFYRCAGKQSGLVLKFDCPMDLEFDDNLKACNYPGTFRQSGLCERSSGRFQNVPRGVELIDDNNDLNRIGDPYGESSDRIDRVSPGQRQQQQMMMMMMAQRQRQQQQLLRQEQLRQQQQQLLRQQQFQQQRQREQQELRRYFAGGQMRPPPQGQAPSGRKV